MEAFLAHLSAPAIFASQSRLRLKPGTVKQYLHGIVMLISALAEAGEDLASLTRLGDVVTASKVEKRCSSCMSGSGSGSPVAWS